MTEMKQDSRQLGERMQVREACDMLNDTTYARASMSIVMRCRLGVSQVVQPKEGDLCRMSCTHAALRAMCTYLSVLKCADATKSQKQEASAAGEAMLKCMYVCVSHHAMPLCRIIM